MRRVDKVNTQKIILEGEQEFINKVREMKEEVKEFNREMEKLNGTLKENIQLLTSIKEIQSQKDTDNEDR